MLWLDRLAAGMLAPLAMWVLASGLDDLFLDLCSIYFWLAARLGRRRRACVGGEDDDRFLREKKIALLIPAWREHEVIEAMLEHNIGSIRYSNYEIFVGVYPNDVLTLAKILAVVKKHARVHHVACPHEGPTSKADCLNWIYEGVLRYEEEKRCHFEVILHHDAEDVIHPRSLGWINRHAEHYDMVQVPVLPLETPWWELTHGVYCDDFAQSHLRELHTRIALGGFCHRAGWGRRIGGGRWTGWRGTTKARCSEQRC